MTTDYSKKTNAELVDILKSRSLPHTGKKAELVSRIQEDDAKTQPAEPAPAAKADAAEDVIDWEDDDEPAAAEAAKPTTEASAATVAAGGKGPVPNPVAVPNQKLDVDPATTEDLKVESKGEPKGDAPAPEGAEAEPATSSETAQPAEEEKPAVDYSIGLATTELEEELKKRKARAEKFGITEDSQAAIAEAEKKLERAKRFGAEGGEKEGAGVEKLDAALPSENRKRGRAENDQGERGDKKRHFGSRGNFRGRGNHHARGGRGGRGHGRGFRGGRGGRGGRGHDNHRGQRPHPNTKDSGMSEKDKAAMEARKKRFATA
ncbi:hypothetical protein P170DRAFT_443563 [Aspergillus steynii IBT 23096]|uniref:SAP domain-containing protein n=1 Tax=Aspergillus steynii IBT 23096 TaxID=1392250 RepID=A0A2I2GSL0_9EURO|nr:uncharacterized protein P170DRAFT_443563 [Aspergillus steynii IBT 23096]PLB55858.1 hypothetical protein P170DRAFT_443563 [Aspergillus steynii IBT 23096]